jgi:hypothetical protein
MQQFGILSAILAYNRIPSDKWWDLLLHVGAEFDMVPKNATKWPLMFPVDKRCRSANVVAVAHPCKDPPIPHINFRKCGVFACRNPELKRRRIEV